MISVKTLRIPRNYVLVKPDDDYETYQIEGRETGIYAGYNVDSAGQIVAVTGTVYKAPEKLDYLESELDLIDRQYSGDERNTRFGATKEKSVLYDVPVEVKPGDKVLFWYKNQFDVFKDGRVLRTDEGTMYLIKYDTLYCRVDEGGLYPLNGLVFVENITAVQKLEGSDFEVKSSGIIVPEFQHAGRKIKKSLALAKIVAAGCVVRGYLDFRGIADDTYNLKPGDFIIYNEKMAKNLQYDLHRTLTKENTIRIHRKDIYGVIKQSDNFDVNEILSKLKINK